MPNVAGMLQPERGMPERGMQPERGLLSLSQKLWLVVCNEGELSTVQVLVKFFNTKNQTYFSS